LHSAFPAGHAMNPVVQLTGMHGDLDYSLLPKRNPPGMVGTFCLDPFLIACKNGSPALLGREASEHSSALQGMSPYFRNVSHPKHSELFSYLKSISTYGSAPIRL
jgi:hypothetical protein